MAAANGLANFSSDSNLSTEWNNFAQTETSQTFANLDNSTVGNSLESTNWSAKTSPASNLSNNIDEPFVILKGKVREGVKKKGKEAVRLTAWVDPPLPLPPSGQENVKKF